MKMVFELCLYDLLPDGEGGLCVNDIFKKSQPVVLRVRPKTYNKGTQHEAIEHYPSDRQLNQAVGVRGLKWDGEVDYTLYATDKNGNPACELRRVS